MNYCLPLFSYIGRGSGVIFVTFGCDISIFVLSWIIWGPSNFVLLVVSLQISLIFFLPFMKEVISMFAQLSLYVRISSLSNCSC